MNVYFFIGGAYGDCYWQQTLAPTEDQWKNWANGELVIIKVDSELRGWQPDGIEQWRLVKQIMPE